MYEVVLFKENIMSDVSNLFEHLLNFGEHWEVTKIDVDDVHQQVEVYVEYTASKAKCPETGDLLPIYDHRKPRRWRHLNMMQYQTWIVCSLPRVKNNEGKVITGPADANQRFTF